MNFVQAKNLNNALEVLASGDWTLLAGGTDFYPALRDQPAQGKLLDLSMLSELRIIEPEGDNLRIGAGVTWSDVINADLHSAFDGLKLCAREIGSIQIQNRATLVGNICNASPAADGVPTLLTLDAIVEISSLQGMRRVPLSEFIIANRQTLLKCGEMVTALLIPNNAIEGRSSFLKLGARKYLVISISMVATRLLFDTQNCITKAAIAVGSCSLVAQRLQKLEEDLMGANRKNLEKHVSEEHLSCLAPIDDVRASADYRVSATLTLIRRAISLAVGDS